MRAAHWGSAAAAREFRCRSRETGADAATALGFLGRLGRVLSAADRMDALSSALAAMGTTPTLAPKRRPGLPVERKYARPALARRCAGSSSSRNSSPAGCRTRLRPGASQGAAPGAPWTSAAALHLPQQGIAGTMATAVVDDLEPIDGPGDEVEGLDGPWRLERPSTRRDLEFAAIDQAGGVDRGWRR